MTFLHYYFHNCLFVVLDLIEVYKDLFDEARIAKIIEKHIQF